MKIKSLHLINGEVLELEVFPVNEVEGVFVQLNENTVLNVIQEKKIGDITTDGSVNIWRKEKSGRYRRHNQLVFTDIEGRILILTLLNSFPGMPNDERRANRELMITALSNLFGFSPDFLRKLMTYRIGITPNKSMRIVID